MTTTDAAMEFNPAFLPALEDDQRGWILASVSGMACGMYIPPAVNYILTDTVCCSLGVIHYLH